jgi:hypothetical protein
VNNQKNCYYKNMHKLTKLVILLIVVTAILLSSWYFLTKSPSKAEEITNFQECVKAGYPVMEIYPEQCRTPDGKTFTKEFSGQPITITGEFLCLPHKNTEGPQTLECAFGIKDDEGNYYALSDSDPEYKNLSGPINKKIKVTGMLKLEDSNKYQSIGTILLEKITQL